MAKPFLITKSSSLRVVLYEMFTGQHPFKGDYEHAVIYSILNEEPEQPRLLRSDLPEHLGKIISKLLEKEPDRRYQNLSELLQDLQACSVSRSTASQPEKSIVVLPFENISPDPEQEYFSDGLTEKIIADLSHIHDLRVISRTSAMILKGTKKDMKTIERRHGHSGRQ